MSSEEGLGDDLVVAMFEFLEIEKSIRKSDSQSPLVTRFRTWKIVVAENLNGWRWHFIEANEGMNNCGFDLSETEEIPYLSVKGTLKFAK